MVVGLGHEMHGDDEIGLEIVRCWVEKYGEDIPGTKTVLLESPGLNLLGLIAGLDAAILVAAIRGGAPPGTVQIIKDEVLTTCEGSSRQLGGWSAAETLSLGRHLAPEDLPEKLVLIGIEGAAFGLGEGLSPAVRAAIPEALRALNLALKEIKWKNRPLKQVFDQIIRYLRKKPDNS